MRMRSLTNAELALMTLLAEKPMHGYEIEQLIEKRGMREWTQIGFSSIYYLLEKLNKSGLLSRQGKASKLGGPVRKIFELTEKGYAAWKAAITTALAHPASINSPFQIALSALPLLDKDLIRFSLENHARELRLADEKLTEKLSSYAPAPPPHVRAMFNLSKKQITATTQWIDEYLEENYRVN